VARAADAPLAAAIAGVIKGCLRKDDYICSTYRDHVHALSKGVSARKVMAELFGKKTGCCRGQGGSMHMFDAEFGLVRTGERDRERKRWARPARGGGTGG
jgi:TPP-dependent pyruvate/acetoin dehydrogenase alpha subunit